MEENIRQDQAGQDLDMSKIKKKRPWWRRLRYDRLLLAIALSLGLVYGIYRLVDKFWVRPIELFEMAPDNAPFYVLCRDVNVIDRSLNAAAYAREIRQASFYQRYRKELAQLEQMLKQKESVRKEHIPVLSCFFPDGSTNYDYLHIIYAGNISSGNPNNYFQSGYLKSYTEQERKYKGYSIFESHDAGGKIHEALLYCDGFFMVSTNPALIDHFIKCHDRGKSLDHCKGLYGSFGKKQLEQNASLIINYNALNALAPLFASTEGEKVLQQISQTASFSTLNIDFTPASIMLKGKSSFGDISDFHAARLLREVGLPLEMASVLPDNISLLCYSSTAEPDAFFNDVPKNETTKKQLFTDWVSKEWAFFKMETYEKEDSKSNVLVVRTKNVQMTLDALKPYTEAVNDKTIYTAKGKFPIQRLKLNDELNHFFDNGLIPVKTPYYFYINNYFFFCNDASGAQAVLRMYEQGKVLSKNKNFKLYADAFGKQHSSFTYFNPALGLKLLQRWVVDPDSSIDAATWARFSPVAINFGNEGGYASTQISIAYHLFDQSGTNMLYQIALDTTTHGSAHVIEDPYNHSHLLAVQDDRGYLYLLSASGELLWSKWLDSKLMSEIYAIDYYNNQDIQFAFNTQNFLFIIDRNGNYVEDYPIKLSAAASGGMGLMPAANPHETAFLVPCSNGNVYGYELSGKPLPSWNPRALGSPVVKPIIAFKGAKPQQLIFVCENGMIFSYDAKGNKIWSLPGSSQKSANVNVLCNDTALKMFKPGEAGILSSDKGSEWRNIAINVEDAQVLRSYTVPGSWHFRHVILEEKRLRCVDENGKELMQVALPEEMQKQLFVLEIGTAHAFALINKADDKIYLYDEKGKLWEGFPLAGAVYVATSNLFNNGVNYIFTVSRDGRFIAYRI